MVNHDITMGAVIGLQLQVKQGALGDCWLIGAFACLADFPGHVPWAMRGWRVWVNYNDLSVLPNPGIIVNKGNHPHSWPQDSG